MASHALKLPDFGAYLKSIPCLNTLIFNQSISDHAMPKRRAVAPLGQSLPEGQADFLMVDQDGSRAPRNSLEQDSNDPQARSDRPDHQGLERMSAHAKGSEDITMGNNRSEEQIEAFKSTLTSKLDAVKDDLGRQDNSGAGKTEDQDKQNDKDEERQQKKTRLEAEEGAGSGRYTMGL